MLFCNKKKKKLQSVNLDQNYITKHPYGQTCVWSNKDRKHMNQKKKTGTNTVYIYYIKQQ